MAIVKHKGQRVGIFIDTQNLYHSAKNLYKSKVNFGQIVKEALAGRTLIRAVAYVIRTESEEEKGFFEALNKVGIETKVKDIRIFAGGAKKADCDIDMALDAIGMSAKLDVVILATGDGDFIPLVDFLRRAHGCQVEVIAFGKSASGQLRDVADDFIDVCENPRNFLIGYRGNGKPMGRFVPGGFGSHGGAPTHGAPNAEEGIDIGHEVYDDSEPEDNLDQEPK